MTRRFILSVAFLSLFSGIAAAQGYRIELLLDDAQKDSTILLARYGGSSKYAVDTALTDADGRAVFSKATPLPGGMYLFAAGGALLFDCLISDDDSQRFDVHYKKNEDKSVEIIYKNSPENVAFSDFQKYLGQRQRAGNLLRERAQKDTAFISVARDSLKTIAEEEKNYTRQIREQWQGKLLASMARAVQPAMPAPEPEIPDDAANPDSLRWLHYYLWDRDHYLDNLDFSDARLLNTPVFQPNFEYYFQHKLIQHPDSIIPRVHAALELAKADSTLFMFCLGHLFNTYIQWKTYTINSEYAMGMEAVVLDIINTYYLSGQAEWAEKDTSFMKSIREYAHYNAHSLVGLPARDLKMITLTGEYVSLLDLQAPYTLLVFFDSNCGHCKTEVPKLHEIYTKYKDRGLQVFCVYTQLNQEEWLKFVRENQMEDWVNVWDPYRSANFYDLYGVTSTPQVFLLNKDKTIIARRVSHDLLSQLLGLYIDNEPLKDTDATESTAPEEH
ncbi:MAG: redoxin domain-containing protein [Prevotellaceae bacterium]|jgi:peroxiredoxin|nr:redoxin domain-containing protein [Prevotellaceae bacterium]